MESPTETAHSCVSLSMETCPVTETAWAAYFSVSSTRGDWSGGAGYCGAWNWGRGNWARHTMADVAARSDNFAIDAPNVLAISTLNLNVLDPPTSRSRISGRNSLPPNVLKQVSVRWNFANWGYWNQQFPA